MGSKKKISKKSKKSKKEAKDIKKVKKETKVSTNFSQAKSRLDKSSKESIDKFKEKSRDIILKNQRDQEDLVNKILGESETNMPSYFEEEEENEIENELTEDSSDFFNTSIRSDSEDQKTFKSNYDIFEYAQKTLEQVGDYPVFAIHRDGEQYPSKYGRYSWDQLQEDLGGGDYTIWAKSKATGRIIKKESRRLAGERKDVFKKEDQQKTEPQYQQVQQKDDFEKLLSIIQIMNMNNKNDASAALIAKSNNDSTTTMMTTIMTQVQEQGRQFQQMLMEIQKASIQSQEKAQQDALRREEKLQERFEKLMEKVTTKKDEFSLKDILEMQSKAMDRGYSSYKEQMEMAKELAEEMSENEKEETPFSSVLKSFAPIIVNGLQNNQAQVQQLSMQDQQRMIEQKRREQLQLEEQKRNIEVEKRKRFEEAKRQKVLRDQLLKKKSEHWQIVAPVVAQDLGQSVLSGRETGLKVFNTLTENKISILDFLKTWPIQDMLKVADEVGIVQMAREQNRLEEFNNFIKEVYEFMEEKTKPDVKPNVVKPDVTGRNPTSDGITVT